MDKPHAEALLRSWHLGQTSSRYESSGGGAATIAHVPGDHGGASYGEFQLSSRAGTLREYLNQSAYGVRFAGLAPGSPEFDTTWRQIAHADPGFALDQQKFIGRTHYEDQAHRLKAQGLDLSHRGPAVQDCIWSTSVQMRNLTPRVFRSGLSEAFGPSVDVKVLSDRQIVEAVQDYKIRHNSEIFSKSPTLWNGLLKRAHAERDDLVRLADAERLAPRARNASPSSEDAHVDRAPRTKPHVPSHGHAPASPQEAVRHAQTALAHLGYTGVDGRLLDIDGRAGRHSRHAIAQFQRDEGMRPTGVLDEATAARLGDAGRTMASSSHPLHGMYRQALDAVLDAEQQRGLPRGRHSVALAGTVVTEAVRSGLTRIDRVELGSTGRFARGIEFGPVGDNASFNHATATIDTRIAVQRPLLTSSEQAASLRAGPIATADQLHRHSAPMRAPVM